MYAWSLPDISVSTHYQNLISEQEFLRSSSAGRSLDVVDGICWIRVVVSRRRDLLAKVVDIAVTKKENRKSTINRIHKSVYFTVGLDERIIHKFSLHEHCSLF